MGKRYVKIKNPKIPTTKKIWIGPVVLTAILTGTLASGITYSFVTKNEKETQKRAEDIAQDYIDQYGYLNMAKKTFALEYNNFHDKQINPNEVEMHIMYGINNNTKIAYFCENGMDIAVIGGSKEGEGNGAILKITVDDETFIGTRDKNDNPIITFELGDSALGDLDKIKMNEFQTGWIDYYDLYAHLVSASQPHPESTEKDIERENEKAKECLAKYVLDSMKTVGEQTAEQMFDDQQIIASVNNELSDKGIIIYGDDMDDTCRY